MRISLVIILCVFATGFSGCENTDVQLATEAGIEAYKAVTLSDQDVIELSRQSAAYLDSRNTVAPAGNIYAKRLQALVNDHHEQDGFTFNYKVYLQGQENAFALADGTIRIYSGLMDMLDDGELRFVIGHEMGHVVKKHISYKLRLAYGASALRKGIASQNSVAGNIARSQLGSVVEVLLGAQFSQLEEKVADDYGLSFLKSKDYAPEKAVSALKKLASLGSDHTYLSSHSDPEVRAERISLQVQGKALSLEEKKLDFTDRMKSKLGFIDTIRSKLAAWFPAIFSDSAKN